MVWWRARGGIDEGKGIVKGWEESELVVNERASHTIKHDRAIVFKERHASFSKITSKGVNYL